MSERTYVRTYSMSFTKFFVSAVTIYLSIRLCRKNYRHIVVEVNFKVQAAKQNRKTPVATAEMEQKKKKNKK